MARFKSKDKPMRNRIRVKDQKEVHDGVARPVTKVMMLVT